VVQPVAAQAPGPAQPAVIQTAAEEQASSTVAGTGAVEDGWWARTSVGGYGELHYEGGSRDQIDLHRFVLFFGHEFTDAIRFYSEVEIEHAYAAPNRPGEVEMEQAFVQLDLSAQHRVNAGLVLMPVGILNITHEPPTFFGVERNPIENNIIPTTWREGGVGISGNFGDTGFSYDGLISSGLNVPLTGSNAFRPRNGRTSVASAPAKSPALTGRVRYTGIPGVELAASGHYQFDMSQDAGDPITGEDVSGFLFSAHADARFGGLGLRALYSSWWIDSAAAELVGRDRQTGFYLEPSYRFLFANGNDMFGLFYRYSWWDNNAGESSLDLDTQQHIFGVNYWPHPDVVFKLDWLLEKTGRGAETDRLNAGVGFQF
jgi:hypothetical protein